MSSYFDAKQEMAAALIQKAQRLDRAEYSGDRSCCGSFYDDLKKLDETVVFDCSTCVEFPGCPEEIRQCVAECIYKYSIECQPINRASRFCPSCDTAEEHATSVARMIGELHSIFHDLAGAGLEGFSDSPLVPLRRLYSIGEERRERLVPREEFTEVYRDGGDPL